MFGGYFQNPYCVLTMNWWPPSAEYKVGTCRRNSIQRTPPEAFLEESSTYFCLLGKCCLNSGITNQKFPMFCKCHFSSSAPCPPRAQEGVTRFLTRSIPSSSAEESRDGHWHPQVAFCQPTGCTLGVKVPRREWGQRGKPKETVVRGHCEGGAVPRGHSSWNC